MQATPSRPPKQFPQVSAVDGLGDESPGHTLYVSMYVVAFALAGPYSLARRRGATLRPGDFLPVNFATFPLVNRRDRFHRPLEGRLRCCYGSFRCEFITINEPIGPLSRDANSVAYTRATTISSLPLLIRILYDAIMAFAQRPPGAFKTGQESAGS